MLDPARANRTRESPDLVGRAADGVAIRCQDRLSADPSVGRIGVDNGYNLAVCQVLDLMEIQIMSESSLEGSEDAKTYIDVSRESAPVQSIILKLDVCSRKSGLALVHLSYRATYQ